jgi:hypothetical protein
MITRAAPRTQTRTPAQISQVHIPEPISVTRKELAKHRSTKRRAMQIERRIKALTQRADDPAAAVQLNALSARLQALRG